MHAMRHARRLPSAAVAVLLAVVVLPAWGTGAPPIDWAQLPAEPVEVLEGTTVVRCSEFEPILCVTQEGLAGRGGIEYLSFPVATLPELSEQLAAGATVREALEAYAQEFHAILATDRAAGCPSGYRYLPEATRPALVAGEQGVRYGFTVVDGADRVVERVTSFATLSGDALQLLVASALAEGACLEDIGYNFTPAALEAFQPAFAQLVARAMVPLGRDARETLTIPVGGDGVTYDEPDGQGEMPVGPSAIAVDGSGTSWIVDVEADRLVRVGADGTLLGPVDLSAAGLQAMWDLDVRGDGFVLLGSDPMGVDRMVVLDARGAMTAVHELPAGVELSRGLSGLAVVDGGAVVAEFEGGARLVQVLDADGRPSNQPVEGYRLHGRSYRVQPGGDDRLRAVVVDGRVIEVRTGHDPAGLHLLGAEPDGTFTVVVEELGPDPQRIEVDRTLRRYDVDGRLLGSARDDLSGRHTVVERPFAVAADGTVVALRTHPDHAEIVPLRFSARLAPLFPPAQPVRHLSADDAVATAIALSSEAHPAGSVTRALLAREDVFADALASGGLQGILDAPLLLTAGGALDGRVLDELQRLGARSVTVLGGTAAVAPAVLAALEGAGFAVDRLGGATRVETAAVLARAHAPQARRAVLVRADGPEASQAFADALAAGAMAAAAGDPVLLTPTDGLAGAVRDFLTDAGVREVVVAGGEAAVSGRAAEDLEALGITVDRAGGGERAATAVALAARRSAPTAAYVDGVILVDGRQWADGLAAASLSARQAAPVLVVDGDLLPPATAAHLNAAQDPPVVWCTPSVTAAACSAAAQAAGRTMAGSNR